MKEKLDFVTNSSSCSFVAWGITSDVEEFKEKYGKKLFELHRKKQDEKAQKNGAMMPVIQSTEDIQKEYEEFLSDDFTWSVEKVLNGFEVAQIYYDDAIMIGKSPFSIGENQTNEEYKQEICDGLNKIGMDIKPSELDAIEESWMDG